MKTTLVNIRLPDNQIQTLDTMAGDALNRQAIARMLLSAAIDAVQRNQGRLNFPILFEIAASNREISPHFEMNEPKKARK